MLLTKFRVTEFRSVQDSGWIDAEQITALIGTNESGKTNIMLPLCKMIYLVTNIIFIAMHHKSQFLFVPNTN